MAEDSEVLNENINIDQDQLKSQLSHVRDVIEETEHIRSKKIISLRNFDKFSSRINGFLKSLKSTLGIFLNEKDEAEQSFLRQQSTLEEIFQQNITLRSYNEAISQVLKTRNIISIVQDIQFEYLNAVYDRVIELINSQRQSEVELEAIKGLKELQNNFKQNMQDLLDSERAFMNSKLEQDRDYYDGKTRNLELKIEGLVSLLKIKHPQQVEEIEQVSTRINAEEDRIKSYVDKNRKDRMTRQVKPEKEPDSLQEFVKFYFDKGEGPEEILERIMTTSQWAGKINERITKANISKVIPGAWEENDSESEN